MPEIFGENHPQASVPSEIEKRIFYLFSRRTLNSAKLVNKAWKEIVDTRDASEVVVYIWLPSPENGGKTGHISLETFSGNIVSGRKGIHASFWPGEEISRTNFLSAKNGIFSLSMDYDQYLEKDQPPDYVMTLYSFDVKKINESFSKFLNVEIKDPQLKFVSCSSHWSLLGSSVLKFRNFNCCSVIAGLLYVAANKQQKEILAVHYPFYFKENFLPISYWPQHVRNFKDAVLGMFLLFSSGYAGIFFGACKFKLNSILVNIFAVVGGSGCVTAYVDYLLFRDNLITPVNLYKAIRQLGALKTHGVLKNDAHDITEETVVIQELIHESIHASLSMTAEEVERNSAARRYEEASRHSMQKVQHSVTQIKIGLGEMNPLLSLLFEEFLPNRLTEQKSCFWKISTIPDLSATNTDSVFEICQEDEANLTIASSHNAVIRVWRPLNSKQREHVSLEVKTRGENLYLSFWSESVDDKHFSGEKYLYRDFETVKLRTLAYDLSKLGKTNVLVKLFNLNVDAIVKEIHSLSQVRLKFFENSMQMINRLLKKGKFQLTIPIDYYHAQRLKSNPYKLSFPALVTGAILGGYHNGFRGLAICTLASYIFSAVYYRACERTSYVNQI